MTPATGFAAWAAWQQPETYQFFALQGLAVVLAMIISARDSNDRK